MLPETGVMRELEKPRADHQIVSQGLASKAYVDQIQVTAYQLLHED
jgi:hypothetical protein